jgi:hypothetical protein
MAQCEEIEVRMILTNKKDLDRIAAVCCLLEEMAEEMPWRDELKEAVELLDEIDLEVVPEKILELWAAGKLVKCVREDTT